MRKPQFLILTVALVMPALAPLEFAQNAAPVAMSPLPPPPPPPPPPPSPAPMPASGSARGRGVGGTAFTAGDMVILNQVLRNLLSTTSSDCKKILDANPAYQPLKAITGPRGRGGATGAIPPAGADTINKTLRDLLAADSADSKKALDAHPSLDMLTISMPVRTSIVQPSGRAAVSRSGAGSSQARATRGAVLTPLDIPTAAELAALNASLRNVLEQASPDAKRILDAHPTYALISATGVRANFSAGTNRGRGPATPPPPATGRGSRVTPSNNGQGGQN